MARLLKEYDINFYSYDLPEGLIASFPAEDRSASRLLVIDRRNQDLYFHHSFTEIKKYFQEGDLLVLNKTKVFPARIKARKKTGGKAEVLTLSKPLGSYCQTEALIKGKRIKPGLELVSEGEKIFIKVLEVVEGGKYLVELQSEGAPLEVVLKEEGLAPLPPYIKREPEKIDLLRYQTIYAEDEGAVAAPTAGLHFTRRLLQEIANLGVKVTFIVLHVGYSTFKPVKVRDIRKHTIDPEYLKVPAEVVEEVKVALDEGRRVIACGTTTVRALEFIAQKGMAPYEGMCDLYIYPGFVFKVVSAMITNFHLPRSSLLLLVSAFAGRDLILKAYEEAIKRGYRFYSYGDATFII